MKAYLPLVFGLLILASCGSENETAKESSPKELKETASPAEVETEIIVQPKLLNVDLKPHQDKVKEYLENFFIQKNSLVGGTSKLTSTSMKFGDSLKKFTFEFSSTRLEADYNEGEEIELKDEASVIGEIISSEKKDQVIFLEITGEIVFESQYMTFYGPMDEVGDGVQFNEIIEVNLNESPPTHLADASLHAVGVNRKFSRSELQGKTIEELGYLRNEFYARRGHVFGTDKMRNYFESKTWYPPEKQGVKDVSGLLTEIELHNIFLIKAMEEEIRLNNNENADESIESVYEIAIDRLLTSEDLKSISTHQLPFLRNEIYARKGLIFKSKRYQEYFETKSWYEPSNNSVDGLLTDLEIKNAAMILSIEKARR